MASRYIQLSHSHLALRIWITWLNMTVLKSKSHGKVNIKLICHFFQISGKRMHHPTPEQDTADEKLLHPKQRCFLNHFWIHDEYYCSKASAIKAKDHARWNIWFRCPSLHEQFINGLKQIKAQMQSQSKRPWNYAQNLLKVKNSE